MPCTIAGPVHSMPPTRVESDEAMIEQWTSDTEETMLLLQEEIQRLENELRLRDEALAVSNCAPAQAGLALDESRPLYHKIDELKSELSSRDESIALLLEQI